MYIIYTLYCTSLSTTPAFMYLGFLKFCYLRFHTVCRISTGLNIVQRHYVCPCVYWCESDMLLPSGGSCRYHLIKDTLEILSSHVNTLDCPHSTLRFRRSLSTSSICAAMMSEPCTNGSTGSALPR